MRPLVSLLVPVYNAMPYFAGFLRCVAEQTWRPLECILADDGSTDGSAAYLASFRPELERAEVSVRVLTLPHGGQAAAINAALKSAAGEYLTWCDSDDIMLPRCIEAKTEYLLRHPELGMVRSDGLVLNGDTGEILSHSAREEDRQTRQIFDELLRQTTYCYAGCYMVRMELFDQCYPEREIPLSPEGQNLQLLLPPASRSKCGFLPEVLHHYYRRSSGHSSMKRSYTESLKRAKNFSALCREILPFCACDREHYEEEIKRIEQQRMEQLRYSLLIRAKEELKKDESRDPHLS